MPEPSVVLRAERLDAGVSHPAGGIRKPVAMEVLIASLAALAVALLGAGIVGLVNLNSKVASLVTAVEGLAVRFGDHKEEDERRFQRLEESQWSPSRAR
jgi:hypothetical protein